MKFLKNITLENDKLNKTMDLTHINKKFIKINFLILLSVMTLFISGCWNYKEIDQLAIASGIAIDKEDSKFIVTCEVIKMTSSNVSKPEVWMISMKGNSVFDAIRHMIKITGKKIYWGHAQVVIISNKIAKSGIIPAMDLLSRDAEPRYTLKLMISKEKTAKQILKQKSKSTDINSFELYNILKNEKSILQAPNVEFWQFQNTMPEHGKSAVLPVVSQIKNNSQVVPKVAGTAVFRKDKMVGYLNGDDTKTFLFITDQIRGGLLTNKESLKKKYSTIVLEIFNNKTKIEPKIINGKLTMKISIQTSAAFAENCGTIGFLNKKGIKKITNDFERQLENKIKNLVKKVQNNYDSDIFGFGIDTKINMPNLWRKIERKWDVDFKKVQVSVDSKITIKNSALESKTLKAND